MGTLPERSYVDWAKWALVNKKDPHRSLALAISQGNLPEKKKLSKYVNQALEEVEIKKKARIYPGFDEDLWKGGVEEGAFAGDKDPDGKWYLMEFDGKKVALAAAVPGPADLVNISYYVAPDERGKGYGTKIASQVTDLFEKATFTIMKDNEASIKVALAALRDKFSMTLGHNVVRLTKTAEKKKEEKPESRLPSPPLISYLDDVAMILKGLKEQAPAIAETAVKAAEEKKDEQRNTIGTTLESKIHESFTVAADRLLRAGVLDTQERIALSGVIGDMLGRFRKQVAHGVHTRKMTDLAHEHLKHAVSHQTALAVQRARVIQAQREGISSPQAMTRKVERAAADVAIAPTTPASPEKIKETLGVAKFVKSVKGGEKGGDIYAAIRKAVGHQSTQRRLF